MNRIRKYLKRNKFKKNLLKKVYFYFKKGKLKQLFKSKNNLISKSYTQNMT